MLGTYLWPVKILVFHRQAKHVTTADQMFRIFLMAWKTTLFLICVSVFSMAAEAADLPKATEDLIGSYRYLEARSQDFLEKFDKADDPMSEKNYAELIATRILREQAAHMLAERLLRDDASDDEIVLMRELKAPEKPGSYISSLPLLDDVVEALGHLDDVSEAKREVRRDLLARLERVYSAEERLEVEKAWGTGETVREARTRARTFKAEKTLETEIQNYARRLVKDVVLPPSRSPSASVSYRPSTGPEGNLTGREFPSKMWAITYDDGPARQTAQILDELLSRNMKATFFWLSKNAPNYEKSAVARAKKEGHGLANHSATHQQLTKLGPAGLDKEITESTKTLARIYGQSLGFFRLPYGSGVNNSAIRDRIAKAGMIHVYWNVDTLDWQDRNPDTLYNRTMKQIARQGRGVILFHDIHSQTVIASRRMMDDLRKQGAKVVTMAEAVSAINGVTP